jgi:hypothetical protein
MARKDTRRWVTAIVGIVTGLIASMLVMDGASAASANVLEYAQCANDAPPSSSLECPGGFINGILQASNSHYREDEVTPQRLLIKFNTTGPHSITIRYSDLKGTTHAYDSLASFDYTQTGADRCAGVTSCPSTPSDTAMIPDDGASVGTATGGYSTTVTPHMIPATIADHVDREFRLYGGTFQATKTSGYFHEPGYTSITVNITVPTTNTSKTVQLTFGGHLAAPSGSRGWGSGLGAADINGGPYHIKLDKVDGASIGNRDNQIMGSAILQYFSPALTSDSTVDTAFVGTTPVLSDTAYYVPAGASTAGAVTFALYGPFDPTTVFTGSECTTAVAGTALSPTTWGADPDQVNHPGRYVASSGNFTPTNGLAEGDYYWVVSYAGDGGQTLPSTHGCGVSTEKVEVRKASPGVASTISLQDTLTVTGVVGAVAPTGNVNFKLYRSSTTVCEDVLVYDSDSTILGGSSTSKALNGSGTATSDVYVASTAGTYNWVVTYAGDTNNNGSSKACGTETAVVSYP